MTLQDRIAELVKQHGSLRAAARVLDTDAGYLSRLATGKILRTGSTLYELNAMGYNRWSALVQPGHDDNDKRISESECERIAAALSGAPGVAAADDGVPAADGGQQ